MPYNGATSFSFLFLKPCMKNIAKWQLSYLRLRSNHYSAKNKILTTKNTIDTTKPMYDKKFYINHISKSM